MTNNNFLKGETSYSDKQYQEAIKFYSECIAETDKHVESYYKRGMCFFHLNKKEEALVDFTIAQKIDNKNPFRYASRAFILDSLGKTEEAISDYEKAIELDPTDAIAHNNLGLLQEKLGWKDKAEKNYNKADNLSEDFFKNITPVKEQIDTKKERIEEVKKIETDAEPSSFLKEIKLVFTSKKTFTEFIKFVKNGFKLKE